MTTHAPVSGQRHGTGQQKKSTGETRDKLQTSLVASQQFLDTINTIAKLESRSKRCRDVTGDNRNTTEEFVVAVELPDSEDGEHQSSKNQVIILSMSRIKSADGKLEGDEDDEIADGLGFDDEDKDEDSIPLKMAAKREVPIMETQNRKASLSTLVANRE